MEETKSVIDLLIKIGLNHGISETDDYDTIGEKFLNNAKANYGKLNEMASLLDASEKERARWLVGKIEERINQMPRVKRGLALHIYGETLDELEHVLN